MNLLRAFAALAVVVYHVIELGHWSAFPTEGPLVTFRIGWIGVDLFFVISGFVIAYSAIILRERDPRGFAASYWKRRLTRILPLYVLTIAAWLALDRNVWSWDGRTLGWQLFTHLAFIHTFFQDTHSAIDGVNWTLAIEMQFYLLIALLGGWIARAPAWRIALYALLVSWAWRACMFGFFASDGAWVLFMRETQLPGTLDEFAAGTLLAKWVLARPSPAKGETLLWLAGALLLGWAAMAIYWQRASYWNIPEMVIFWRTALAAFLACVVALAVRLPQEIARRLAPVDYLGEISYGIYLWHLFAIEWVVRMRGMREIEAVAGVVGLTVLLASCSWYALEKPFMRLARRPRAPSAAAA